MRLVFNDKRTRYRCNKNTIVPVQKTRDSWCHGWLQSFHIVHEIAHVAAKEADAAAVHVNGNLADALQHVR